MIITKEILDIKVYESTGLIGAVEWKITSEDKGETTSGLVRTMFTNYDTTTIDVATITDSELITICEEIEGGQSFIDYILGIQTPTINENYELSLMTSSDATKAAAEKVKVVEDAVQAHLDEVARTHNYDSILSACSYAAYTNPYQTEGQSFIAWRGDVWAYCYQVLADVEAGTRTEPTITELIAELPVYTPIV